MQLVNIVLTVYVPVRIYLGQFFKIFEEHRQLENGSQII